MLGTFVELELMASPDELDAARACLAALAPALGLRTASDGVICNCG